ncbi:MAG: hypothetical protein IJ751_02125 [Oscillospiraceae bacterium]|nr:hypothetical protein [Oscillospiraceae bacterium]
MADCTAGCGSCCGSCGSCGGGGAVTLTQLELNLLQTFAETSFLPVGRTPSGLSPMLLADGESDSPQTGLALTDLKLKGLIRIDYDLPLSNFDYDRFPAYSVHGSAALTAYGQEVLELLEIQGIEA